MQKQEPEQSTPVDTKINDRADNIVMTTIIAAIVAAGVVPAACREFGRPHKQPASSGPRSELLQPPPAQSTPPQVAPDNAPVDKKNVEPAPAPPIRQQQFSGPVFIV